MKEWIPLVQVLIWPIFIAVLLLAIRPYLVTILKSIADRIKHGDPFQAGPGGISLGQSERKLTRIQETPAANLDAVTTISAQVERGEARSNIEAVEAILAQYAKVIYLVHGVSAPRMDTDGVERREVLVKVDADSQELLAKIDRVVYHLHPTFPEPEREVKNASNQFALSLRVWGEFNLVAQVYFKEFDQPLPLFRYLNF